MGRFLGVLLFGLATAAIGMPSGEPEAPVSPEFKIRVGSFALRPEPISTEEIVARAGRIYQFRSGTSEVVVIDPARKRVELIDLQRKVQAEISFDRLDEAARQVGAKLREAIAKREASGTRADAVEAEMTRALAEPKLRRLAVARPELIRLANPTIEIDARGEGGGDPARLALEILALESIAKLGAFQTPDDLPPFAELDTLAILKASRLRPTEISYLYRLAGPPRRFRRTYRLVPELTDREREAVGRIDRVRESAPMLRYERYRSAK